MPIDVLMPQLSPTMTEGRLANWTVKEGDKINAGDVLAEVETDKATMEVEASEDGIVHSLIGKSGEDIKVGVPIAVLKSDGEKVPADYKPKMPKESASSDEASDEGDEKEKNTASEKKSSKAQPQAAAPATGFSAAPTVDTSNVQTGSAAKGEHVAASPLARRMAQEAGISLNGISGSGPHGRIVKTDVEQAMGLASGAIVRKPDELVSPSPMRKSIANRLTQAKQWVPHFYLEADVNMDALMDARRQLNAAAPKGEDGNPAYKVSVNDFIIKACACALRDYPDANASWSEEGILRYGNVDVSVAVATPGGLITPVVRNADKKKIVQMSAEMKSLAKQAREGALKPEQYEGGGFSLSNLGMYGVKQFAAIINPPQAAILAVGQSENRVLADENGDMYTASVMGITLSVDHRVVDGALGAELLAAIKFYLENPVAMLV